MTDIVTDTVAERVALGVALLDEKCPDWVNRIDLSRLDIASCNRCILGQLFGDFGRGYEPLDIWTAEPYGFMPEYEQIEAMQAEWVRVIADRRSAVEVQP